MTQILQIYYTKGTIVKEKLESLGFELTAQPEGAFYIFPSIKRFTENDFEFCVDVLKFRYRATEMGTCSSRGRSAGTILKLDYQTPCTFLMT